MTTKPSFRKLLRRMRSTIFERISGLRHNFSADRSGAVIMLFALTLIPIISFVGGAIDYANAYSTRSKLQNALDAATLAFGREVDMGSSHADAYQAGMNVLEANLGPDFPPGVNINFNIDGTSVTATGTLNVDTYILGVLGIDIFPVGSTSTVSISGGKLEVVMVLDNSGSMRGTRLAALKHAARTMSQILIQSSRDRDNVKIGVVPFAASVNVGPRNSTATWMDQNGSSSIHYENLSPQITRWAAYRMIRNTTWAGCVEVRPSPHDITDSVPVNGDTLFVPMFAPDEPDIGRSYSNNYLDDDGGSCGRTPHGETEEQAQEKTCKYDRSWPRAGRPGPNYMCTSWPLQPLTTNLGQVISTIQTMQANGRTNIHEGVMWGWRVLSPEEPFTEGLPYTETDNRKFMIVMTDGANTHGGRSNQNNSDYSAYSYSKHGRLRSPTSSTSRLVEAMNTKTLAGCTNVKASDITVFTIAFNINDLDTVEMLQQCASGNSRAFTINNSDALIVVFEAIANEINLLRITS